MGALYTVADLLAAISEDRMQSFAEGNSWAVTQIVDFPRARQLQIVAAVGDMPDMLTLHDRILEYADSINAGIVSTLGRRGWFHHALARGWKVKARNFLFHREM